MASSEVELCNSALVHLGAGFITSLDDNTDEARACKRFYASARDALLTEAEWSFARTQAQLTKLSSAPLFGYAYKYLLPTSPYCLKPLFIENQDLETDWKVEGRELLTDIDGIKLAYIFRNTDVSQYSPLFELSLGYLIASMIAYPITGSRSMVSDMYKLHQEVLMDAADVDAQIGTTERFIVGDTDFVRR